MNLKIIKMISNIKTAPFLVLITLVFAIGILFIGYDKSDELVEAIKTPPATQEELRVVVTDYAQDLRTENASLKAEINTLKTELASVKEVNSLQSKRTEELATNIGTLRSDMDQLKKQMEVAQTKQTKNDPTTHPLVASQLQNQKPAPGTLDAEIAKKLGKGRAANGDPIETTEKKHAPGGDPLSPKERARLASLLKSDKQPDNSKMRAEFSKKLRAFEKERQAPSDTTTAPAPANTKKKLHKENAKVVKDTSSTNVKRPGK